MKRTIHIPRLLRRSCAFLADAKGLAAIELALILPIALMLMSLVVFGGQAYSVQRKVTLAATTSPIFLPKPTTSTLPRLPSRSSTRSSPIRT